MGYPCPALPRAPNTRPCLLFSPPQPTENPTHVRQPPSRRPELPGVLVNVSVRYWRARKKLNPEDLGPSADQVNARLISLGHKRRPPKDCGTWPWSRAGRMRWWTRTRSRS